MIPHPKPPPDPWHGLKAGSVKLEKSGVGDLIYAVGALRNDSDHQRFGVKVEVELLGPRGEKIGAASDYTQSIDMGKSWNFRALVTDRGAVKGVVTNVTEN